MLASDCLLPLPMSRDPLKGHAALRRGRASIPSATYFLTLGTQNRGEGLHFDQAANALWAEIDALDSSSDWKMRCAVIMPDHLHLLITLGERLSLSQTVQRLKAKTTPALRDVKLSWATGYYDHRLLPEEGALAVFLYIYLNPYRANLIDSGKKWPHYRCRAEDWDWFHTQLDTEHPYPEWLR